jgi:hypothetical protein
MMAKRKVQEDVEITQEENVVDEGNIVDDEQVNQTKNTKEVKPIEDQPPAPLILDIEPPKSIDEMVAQLKNDLIFSSASPSPVIPKVDESPKPTPHRRKVNDIVDLEGNPIKINGRSNSSSVIIGRGM